MSVREIYLNENIVNSYEDNQDEKEYHIPDLNASVEELDISFNQCPSTSTIQFSSPTHFSFDLNDELFMEDVTQIGEVLLQSNSNNELDSGINPNQSLSESHLSMSSEIGENIVNKVTNLQSTQVSTRKKNLCNADRMVVYNALLGKSIEGKLMKWTLESVGSQLSVSKSIVQRIWRQGKNSGVHVNVSHKRTKKCCRKKIELDLNKICEFPLRQRTTIRSIACALNIGKSTLHRHLRLGLIRRHSNAIKPLLKEENKRARLQFCLSMLDGASLPHDPIFSGMHNIIYIDEKWFYMTKKCENYYLVHDEEEPMRTCKSKSFIEKVMFLVSIAHPRFDANGNDTFSGKIIVFPLVTQVPAKRNSINRAARTLETKLITSVTKQLIKSCLIEQALNAIMEKWPREDRGSPIFIQQDNARTHIDCDDEDFRRAASQSGFDICLMCQPANSPYLNILDLGYFSAIQSLQYKESPNSVDELVKAVEKSFEAFSTVKSNHIFFNFADVYDRNHEEKRLPPV